MADRGIFRVAAQPSKFGGVFALLNLIRHKFKFDPNSKITGLGQVIVNLDEGSEDLAFAMYAGEYCFDEETNFARTQELFVRPIGSKEWQEALLNLSWLRHFSRSNRKLHVHFALGLLNRWNKSRRAYNKITTLSHATIALCTHGREMVRSADTKVQAELMQLASTAIAALVNCKAYSAEQTQLRAIALLYACTAFRGLESLRDQAYATIDSTINQTVADDGATLSRKPLDLINLMSLLLPLREAMRLGQQALPNTVAQALQKMFTALATFTLADGELPSIFALPKLASRLKLLKAFDNANSQPLALLSQSGFARLEAGKTSVFVDSKKDFTFEFSSGSTHLVKAACSSHSEAQQIRLHESSQGQVLHVAESAVRQRIYFLSPDGLDLRVEDRFEEPIEIKLQFSAMIKITTRREGGVMLVAPDNSVWLLSLRGGEIKIEQNGTTAILKSIAIGQMNWALKKQPKTAKQTQRMKNTEPDLLV